MGVKVNCPTTSHCDDKVVATNTTAMGSILGKKHLALPCHFCRENFSAEVVDIRWVDTKHNMADAMTKALTTSEFHPLMNKAMNNS